LNLQILVVSVYLACGAILLFLSGVILKEDSRNRVNRATSLMLFFGGLGPLLASLGIFLTSGSGADTLVSSSPFTHNIFYVWEFFFPSLLLFSLVFPEQNSYLKRYPRIKYLIFLPHIFHTILVLVFYQPEKIIRSLNVEQMGSLARFFLDPISLFLKYVAVIFGILYKIHVESFSLINLIFLILAVWFLHRGYRKITVYTLKKQVGLLMWGIRSAVGLYAIAFIVPALTPLDFSENVRYFITIVALMVGSGSIAWAIIKHHFLDVKLIVRQSLVYFLTTAIVVGIYFLVLKQFGSLVQNMIGREIPALDVGVVILAIIFFQPIMGQLDDLIKKFFIREKSDYRGMMETFSRKLVTIFDFKTLKETVTETLKKEMMVEKVYVCTPSVKTEGRTKTSQYVLGSDDPAGEQIYSADINDPLIVTLREKTRPTYLADFKTVEETSPFFRTLTELGIFLLVPLVSQNELDGFIGLSKKTTHFRYSYEDITLLDILANQMVIAMSNARLYQESLEKQRLEEELNLARQIQLGLLPKFCPQTEFFELSAHIHPATAVGGDYYDFLYPDSKSIGIAIADASGKGIPAALLISLVHASLRAEVKNKLSPSLVLSNINQLIFTSTSSEKFATMFYAELHPEERRLCYCNAGHNYPILVHEDGKVEFLETGGMILGAFAEATYQGAEIALRRNDTVFFYSDGLTDNRNPQDEEFGESRLLDFLLQNRSLTAEGMKERLIEEVTNFSQGAVPFDDLTMVVLKIH
jgi:serine phosphatase RsbU (regulator of sigma subunit)